MEKYIKDANILLKSLPYIKKFNKKTVVIKYGGAAMTDEGLKKAVIENIVFMKSIGINPVIVHGGGKDINTTLEKFGIEAKFINGLRYTTKEVMDIVKMVLCGKVNKDIVGLFSKEDTKAIGLCGVDGNLFSCEKYIKDNVDLGYVGYINHVNNNALEKLISEDYIPVIAPIGTDKEGNFYNINADFAASAIASSLKCEKLIFMSDIDGVLDKEGNVISKINISEVEDLIKSGTISGGMIPKINCAKETVLNGVEGVHIINGTKENSLVLEMFTDCSMGTTIKG